MSKRETAAPYGTWISPVTPNAVVESSISIEDVLVDVTTATVYHIEKRPSEGGRNVLVKTIPGQDVFGKDWNSRTGVHEYGGASVVIHNGIVYFSNISDGRVYSVKEEGQPMPVTPENKAHRYANFAVHPTQPTLIVAILEDHTVDTPSTVVNSLCVIDTVKQSVTTLVSGADFYASPVFSPDGSRFAWQQWFHPDMPWEGAEIFCADVRIDCNILTLLNPLHIAGKKREISVSFPFWSSSSTLVFTSDESGYQNPWIYAPGEDQTKPKPVFQEPVAQDFGGPAWVLGGSPFAPLDSTGKMVLFTAMKEGRSVFYVADLGSVSVPQQVDCPYVVVQNMRQAAPGQPQVVFVGTKTNEAVTVVLCRVSFSGGLPHTTFTTLKSTESSTSLVSKLSSDFLAVPQPKSLQVPPNNEPLHVVFYPPTNPNYIASSPSGEKPPCILNVHGGPTGMTTQGLDWRRIYFTSRGWAWLDVNYGGSSGYGRKYTDRLVDKWGIVDVEDCIQAARILSSAPYDLVDPARVVIRGGSAGGFSVLAALTIGSDVTTFAAGTSSYGISDLRKLAEDTHKFESRYLDKLIGGTVDEIPDVYRQRSPVFHADKIVAPLLILQGEIDRVVPKEQAELIVESIKDRGGHVEYKLYPGEGHGWRQGQNIADALERELTFYERTLKIKAATRL